MKALKNSALSSVHWRSPDTTFILLLRQTFPQILLNINPILFSMSSCGSIYLDCYIIYGEWKIHNVFLSEWVMSHKILHLKSFRRILGGNMKVVKHRLYKGPSPNPDWLIKNYLLMVDLLFQSEKVSTFCLFHLCFVISGPQSIYFKSNSV